MKRCNTCGISKPKSAYTRQKQRNGSYSLMFECKGCASDRQTERYAAETAQQKLNRRDKFYMRAYGISLEQYNQLFAEQEGCCLGCDKHQSEFEKALVVDHSHETKQVRGLLCSGCNLAIGNAKESAATLRKLAVYLEAK